MKEWWSASIGSEVLLRVVGRLTHLWQLICLGNGLCDGVGSPVDDGEEERKRSQPWVEEKSCGRSGQMQLCVMCLYLRTCNPYLQCSRDRDVSQWRELPRAGAKRSARAGFPAFEEVG